jgi:hypothetical protein
MKTSPSRKTHVQEEEEQEESEAWSAKSIKLQVSTNIFPRCFHKTFPVRHLPVKTTSHVSNTYLMGHVEGSGTSALAQLQKGREI